MLSTVADICGIISFIVSFILWFKFDRIRAEISLQKSNYTEEQKKIYIRISALRDNIIKDGIYSLKLQCEIRTQLFSYTHRFKHLLSYKDRFHIQCIIHTLNKNTNDIDIPKLCKHLDYVIARFTKKELM